MAQVLIIDDDALIRALLEKIITGDRHDVTTADSGATALELIRDCHYDVIICDVSMRPVDGLGVLRACREYEKDTPVIMISAKTEIQTALQTIKEGAYDYITKPIKLDLFLKVFRHCIKYLRLEGCVDQGMIPYVTHPQYQNFIAESKAMKLVFGQIPQISSSHIHYLVRGEYGSGRKTLVQLIHEQQTAAGGCLHQVDCLHYPESITDSVIQGGWRDDQKTQNSIKKLLYRISEDSTLCIVDADQLPDTCMELLVSIQHNNGIWDKYAFHRITAVAEKNLLQKLQDEQIKPFRLAIITKPGLKPADMGTEVGRDFMTCCSTVTIDIPPLRERKEDIIPLAYYFLHKVLPADYKMPHMDRDLQLALETYTWPGNVAELHETMLFMLKNGYPSELTPDMLPELIQVSIGMLPASTLAESSLKAYRCQVLRTLLYAHMKKVSAEWQDK